MKIPEFDDSWPDSWKTAFRFDEIEIWGRRRKSSLGHTYAYNTRRKHTLSMLTNRLPLGSSILDVAAAQGNFSLALAEEGYRVTWNDLRGELAEYTQLKYEKGELTYAPGDCFALDTNEPFDCVLITEIIEHVAHPDRFLKKVAGLVREGGLIVMSTPNGGYFINRLPKFSECQDPGKFESVQFQPDGDGHIFILYPDEIEPLGKQAGLTLEEHRLFSSPLTIGHLKLSHLLPLLPEGLVQALETSARSLPKALRQKIFSSSATCYRKAS